MSLKEYKQKRDFKKTPEPAGREKPSSAGNSYLIQKHAASRLHYDLRLELDGTLKSWAVPKGPSYNPEDKRLAVHVEDHPIEYGTFEGTIPKGEYGGGTVMLWDRGTWESQDPDPRRAYKDGKMKFLLHGERLQGGWALVRMKSRDGDGNDNWLLIKERDEFADKKRNVLKAEPNSVASGRSVEEIAEAEGAVWSVNGSAKARSKKAASKPKRPAAKAATTRAKKLDAAGIPEARKKAQPTSVKPQLCTLVKEIPEDAAWLHEVKFDGYRIVAFVRGGKVELQSRNGKSWTGRFPDVAEACGALDYDCILDGEVVVQRPDGTTDFQALQNFLRERKKVGVTYFAFDVIHLDGYDLTSAPLRARKAALAELLERRTGPALQYSDHIEGNGDVVYKNACELNLEGVISKQADSPYIQKRGRYWLKTKCVKSQEFVIGGYTDPGGARKEFGALLLGHYDSEGKLAYAGKVGTGFTDTTLRSIGAELRKRERKTPPFADPPRGADAKGAHWLRPDLVCETEFTEWTDDGLLRHPSFKGLREDKPATSVTREKPVEPTGDMAVKTPKRVKPTAKSGEKARETAVRKGGKAIVAGVAVSNPDKELYPEGITKVDLVEYYNRIAEHILPYIAHRPLTLVRCPQGRAKKCFYQKHPSNSMPEHVRAVPIREQEGKADYMVIDSVEGLLELVNLGVLEFHTWGCREDNIEKPDVVVFDLDPGPDVTIDALVTAAFVLRDRLEFLGLQTFVKTTGGNGLHVVAPLHRRQSWDDVKEFARGVAHEIVKEDPKAYVATMSKAKRQGRIYIDYLRNTRGATFIVPFSTRARPNAPVSTPLQWDELDGSIDPAGWTIGNIEARLESVPDPWLAYNSVRQSITTDMKESTGIVSKRGRSAVAAAG